jgi:putative ABC transport system substrate-binding protein
MRRLGVLMTTLATDPAGLARAAAFVQGLGALGWKDGGNLSIDWRWAGGNPALFQRYAAEMVALVRRADGVRHRDRRPCSGARPIMSIAS